MLEKCLKIVAAAQAVPYTKQLHPAGIRIVRVIQPALNTEVRIGRKRLKILLEPVSDEFGEISDRHVAPSGMHSTHALMNAMNESAPVVMIWSKSDEIPRTCPSCNIARRTISTPNLPATITKVCFNRSRANAHTAFVNDVPVLNTDLSFCLDTGPSRKSRLPALQYDQKAIYNVRSFTSQAGWLDPEL